MFGIIAVFSAKNRSFFVDEMGQVWVQTFSIEKRKLEFVKIGDIDLSPTVTEENTRG